MTYITTAYATRSEPEQEICAEPVETLAIADCLQSVAEWSAFARRLDTRLTFSALRQHVCLDYELGCVNATTSMQRLKDENLLGNPDQFMAIFCAGVRALASGGEA
jgi:hypothetical protein